MKRALTMFAVVAVAIAALSTAGWAQNPQAVLSWGTTCPTVIKNVDFTVPASFTMYIAAKNLTAADANVGSDINLFYGPNVPDAWRFDDAGCQTGSQVLLNNNANSKTCPAMKGLNSLTITNFQSYPDGRMNVRLAITYDNFTPVAGTTYTLWNLIFDHSFSTAAPTTPGVDCGEADQPICIAMTGPNEPPGTASGILALTGFQVPFQFAAPEDQYVTWNNAANCPGSVPTVPSTWGKVKNLYR